MPATNNTLSAGISDINGRELVLVWTWGNRQKIHGYKKLIIFTKNGNEKIRHFYLTLKLCWEEIEENNLGEVTQKII